MQLQVIDNRSSSATDWQDVLPLSFHPTSGEGSSFQWCFDGFVKLRGRNSNNNGLQGYYTVSVDGGVTFDQYFTCAACHSDGRSGGVAMIMMDGDVGSSGHNKDGMICDAGKWCELLPICRVLVSRQTIDNNNNWARTDEEWSINPDDPSATQFSILDQLEGMGRSPDGDNKFLFEL